MPDPSLTCPCSALRSGVASRRLLPTQNSGEPELLTDPFRGFKPFRGAHTKRKFSSAAHFLGMPGLRIPRHVI